MKSLRKVLYWIKIIINQFITSSPHNLEFSGFEHQKDGPQVQLLEPGLGEVAE